MLGRMGRIRSPRLAVTEAHGYGSPIVESGGGGCTCHVVVRMSCWTVARVAALWKSRGRIGDRSQLASGTPRRSYFLSTDALDMRRLRSYLLPATFTLKKRLPNWGQLAFGDWRARKGSRDNLRRLWAGGSTSGRVAQLPPSTNNSHRCISIRHQREPELQGNFVFYWYFGF